MAIPVPLLINAGTEIVEQLIPLVAPLITPYIAAALRRGEDPATINWTKLYPRWTDELRAEVDRRERDEAAGGDV